MSEDMDMGYTPELTLEGFGSAAAAQEAPAAPEIELQTEEEKKEDPFDESKLTPEEKRMVEEFAKQIDITNSSQIMQYGATAQQKVAQFSESALESVKTKDLGEVGGMISGVVTELKSFDVDEQDKGLFGLFKKSANKATAAKAKYATVEKNVNTIVDALEHHQITLMKDVATLDKLYEMNMQYYKELSMYIIAGKKKLAMIESEEIPELKRKAQTSGTQEDAQAVADLQALADRFEKKLHDLELTRIISMQMAPQIRLVQNNDVLMSDKIQSTIVNTIPLWKSQMLIALGLANSEKAAKAQSEVTNLTNEMLRKNAEKLKSASIQVAKESERGIVDIETLKTTNEQLISTLDEVLQIQTEGRAKRKAAESELRAIEDELRQKLMNARSFK